MLKKIQFIAVLLVLFVVSSANSNTGGPDTFGYSWIDSNAPEPSIQYDWIEISSTGTNSGMYGDDTSRSVAIGFEFDFYGQKYTSVTVGSNGYLTFGPDGTDYSNDSILNINQPNNIIAPFWDDLKTYNNAYYQTIGLAPNRIFIVQYSNVVFYSGSGNMTFQVLMHESGKIVFQYKSLVGAKSYGSSATVGIENSSATSGIQYSYNQSSLTQGLAIQYIRGLSVLSTNPVDGLDLVPLNSNIVLQFDQLLEPASVLSSSITVEGSLSGPIAGTVNYIPVLNTVVFDPDVDFSVDETISATVNSTIQSSGGHGLGADYSWSFVSGAASDEVAPSAVLGLNVSDVPNDGGGVVGLAWSAVADPDFAYYNIYRSTSPIVSLSGAEVISQTWQTNYLDTTTSDGVDHYYAIAAVDYSGNVSTSFSPSGPVASVDDLPRVPSALGSNYSNNGIYLYWNQNSEVDFAGYKIHYGTSTVSYEASVDVGNVTSFTLDGLEDCTDYFIAINAYDEGGNESSLSYEVVRNSGSAGNPLSPVGLTTAVQEGYVDLNWAPNTECDFSRYYIYKSTNIDSGYSSIQTIYGINSMHYRDVKVADGVTYYYKVVAVDSYGLASAYSGYAAATAINNSAPNIPYTPTGGPYAYGLRVYWYGNNNSTGDLAGYKIHYGTVSGEYTQVTTYANAYGSNSNTTLTGLIDCTDYYIAVSAYDLSGNESDVSSELVFNSGKTGAPAAPLGVSASAQDSQITFRWEPSPDCDIQDYIVERSENNSSFSYIGTTSDTSFVDQKIADGHTYYYRIRSRDLAGGTSAYSASVSVTGIDTLAPSPPVNVTSNYYNGYIQIVWTRNQEPDLSHYKINYGTTAGVYTQNITTTNYYYSLYSLTSCTPYYFSVSAVDLSGHESLLSIETSSVFNGSSSLVAPTGLTAASAESVISLSWNANTECDVRGYKIYRSAQSGSGFQEIGSIYNQTSFQDKSLANGTRYYYQVRAFNYSGILGATSAESSALAIDTIPPVAPSSVSLSAGDIYINASWPASSSPDVKEYQVSYGVQPGGDATVLTTSSRNIQLAVLESCQAYYVSVKAIDFSGFESPASPEGHVSTYLSGAPLPPVGIEVAALRDTVTLTWLANSECDISRYEIYRSRAHGAGYQFVGSSTGNSYSNSGLEGDTTYYYVIKVRDVQGLYSANSIEVSVTTGDTIPPVQPVMNADLFPYTSGNSFILRGTKEINSSIIVNGTEIIPLDISSTWVAQVELSQIRNFFDISSADPFGNLCQPLRVEIVRDIQPPVLTTSVPVNNARIHQLDSLTLILSDPTYGAGVDLENSFQDALVKNSAGMAVSGSWSVVDSSLVFTPAAEATLAEGSYSVTLHPVDKVDNAGTVAFGFALDLTPPVVDSMQMNPPGPHKAEAVTFTLNFNEPMNRSDIPAVSLVRLGDTSGISLPVSGNWFNSSTWRGQFSFLADFENGTYNISVSTTQDIAGNPMVDQDLGSFELDTIAPVVPVLNVVTSPTKLATQILSGTKAPKTSLIINGNQRVALNDETSWTVNYPLREGDNNLAIVARDAAGNDSVPAAEMIVLDTIPPAFTVDAYQTHSAEATQTLAGTKEPGCTVSLNGETIFDLQDVNDRWSHDITLVEGIATRLAFVASDAIGNITTRTIDLLYDASPPPALASGVLAADGNGNGVEAILSWPSYVEPVDLAYYRLFVAPEDFVVSEGLTPVATADRGTKSFRVTDLTEGGTYYFAVIPVDISGNFAAQVHTQAAILTDIAPPEDVTGLIAQAGYNLADSNTVTLTWTASTDIKGDLASQVLYVDDGSGYGIGTTLAKTLTSYMVTGLEDAKAYKFKITTRDVVAHESTGRVVQSFTRLSNPGGLSAESGKNSVTLRWEPVSSSYVKHYQVYRKESSQSQVDIADMTRLKSLSATSFEDSGLTNGTTYQYAVTVVNTYGAERTEVQSASATPREDASGPVISGFNLSANQVVSEPVTVEVVASDAESSMDRVELYVDDVLTATAVGGSLSYYWNLVETTDENHSVRAVAFDSLGNSSEATRNVVVNLAAPSAPIITSHVIEGTDPGTRVSITGTAPLYTSVTLKLNSVVFGEVQIGATGAFSFGGLELVEGENLITAQAVNRGGSSPYSSAYAVTVDTGAPPAPTALTAKSLAGGSIQFSWQNAAGETPFGYNLYQSSQVFSSLGDAGVSKANSTSINYLFNELIPVDSDLRYYTVTALDGAGNESGISNVVEVAADSTAPVVHELTFAANDGVLQPDLIAGPGMVNVALTVSEPLKEDPFFSLEPQTGSPIVIALTSIGELHYIGSFRLDTTSPHGSTTWKFSGKDLIGNRGNGQGVGPIFDVRGPVASMTSPVQLQQLVDTPVVVSLTFNEAPTGTPDIELSDASGTSVPVTALVAQGNALHWQGLISFTGLTEGEATFRLVEAKDGFNNLGTDIVGGQKILLYLDAPPAPEVPQDLTVTPEKGGRVQLVWDGVSAVESYKVYRQTAGENIWQLLDSTATPVWNETPAADGLYSYAVSAVGLLDVQSDKSVAVSVSADRLAPESPSGLVLSIDGAGVKAVWSGTLVAGAADIEVPASYNLYRSNASIADISALAPVAGTELLEAVDAAPSSSSRHYVVTALDALGNESAPSQSVEINFPVAPIKDLVLTQLEGGKPELTWQPAEAGVVGYWIYRNGQKLNTALTPVASFIDGYYTGGSVAYGISAVDSFGNESPVREVVLPELTFGLQAGTLLRRGLLETVPLVLTSNAAVTVKQIKIQVGSARPSILPGPFALQAGQPLTVQKVAATPLDAFSSVAVVGTLTLQSAPGTRVTITSTSQAVVTGAGSALEIFSEPLVRDTQAQVRIKVNNLGSARMDLLTSKNNGPTDQIQIYLKDQDGNLLAEGRLDQRTGSQVVNSGGYATARIEPGSSFLSEPINFKVPASAPYAVVLEAVIDNIHYHYNRPEQVVAPGMRQTMASIINEVSYTVSASVEKAVYKQGEPVIIAGSAVSSTTGKPMANVPVRLGISVRGFDRIKTVNTDNNGDFSYMFQPASNEAGSYSVWASHPDLSGRSVQTGFDIIAMSVTPANFSLQLAKGGSYDIPVNIRNLSGAELGELTFELTSSTGIAVQVINSGDAILAGDETQTVKLKVSATETASDTGYAQLRVTTAAGLSAEVNVNLSLHTNIPIVSTSPSYVDTGLVRGTQKVATFTIYNRGHAVLKNARLEGLSTSWMSLTVDPALGDIPVGGNRTVGILLRPPETLTAAVYDDALVLRSDNHRDFTVKVQTTVTSNAVGNVHFDVLNELFEDVSGARITCQHQTLPELTYSLKAGADGTVSKFDIPEGRYTYNISATGHKSFAGSFVIQPGLNITVPIALEVTLVEVEWSVTEIAIEDRYEIQIDTTFETNVPTALPVVEPAGITIPPLSPGEVFNGEFTITNYGLIAADFAGIDFPATFDGYDLEVLVTIPDKLEAKQRVVVPYRVTRQQEAAAVQPSAGLESLYPEVQGFGGESCARYVPVKTSWSVVVCPGAENQRTVTKEATHYISYSVPGCTGGNAYNGGGGLPPQYYGGGSGGGSGGGYQGGGGSSPPAQTTSLNSPQVKEGCVYPPAPDQCSDCETSVTTGSMVDANGAYIFTERDMEIPAPAIPIVFKRTYRSNAIMRDEEGRFNFSLPTPGAFGKGWHSPWFARVGDGFYFDGKGNYLVFAKDAQGNYLRHENEKLLLKKIASGYELSEQGKDTLVFNNLGRLTAIRNERGHAVTFSYDNENHLTSVQDVTGRLVVSISYGGNGLVSSITNVVTDYRVDYSYDLNDNLIAVTDDQGQLNKYGYQSFPQIVYQNVCGYGSTYGLVCDTSGNCRDQWLSGYICRRVLEAVPDEYNYLLARRENALGEAYQVVYNPALKHKGIVSSIIQPDGKPTEINNSFSTKALYYTDYTGRQFRKQLNDDGKLLQLSEIDAEGVETPIKTVEYLPGRIEKTTDASGNLTTVYRDEWDNVIRNIDGEGNETRISYTADGKPLSIADPLGVLTSFEYNEFGDLQQKIRAVGRSEEVVTSFAYDLYGQLIETSVAGVSTSIDYNDLGLPVTITDALGKISRLGYDAAGDLTALVDALGNRSEMTYDSRGNLLSFTDDLEQTTTQAYDASGRLTGVTDALGRISRFEYDFKDRVTAVVDALGQRKELRYDGNGNLVRITEGDHLTLMSYDGSDRLLSLTDPEGNITRYEYNGGSCASCGGGSSEQPAKVTDPFGSVTQNLFDGAGKVRGLVDPLQNLTNLLRDAGGRIVSRTDANGKSSLYEYDALGQVVKQIDAEGGATIFSYDQRGSLLTLTDPQDQTTNFEYDAAGRKTKEIRPMGQATLYSYYANGLLRTVTDPKGQVTTYRYDSASRLTAVTFADTSQDLFAYDAVGNLTSYSNAAVSGTLGYDELNRKITETVDYGGFNKSFSYSYDSFGNKASYTSPEGIEHVYLYDKNSRATSIVFDGNTVSLSYDKTRLAQVALTNGVTTDYSYNANSWLTGIETLGPQGVLLSRDYGFDSVGNIDSKNTEHGQYSYAYDTTYQLTSADNPTLPNESYSYDAVGNRQTSSTTTGRWSHNQNNELLDTSAASYEYDVNGNTLKKIGIGTVQVPAPVITSYEYNARNRLSRVILPNGQVATYSYDPFGRRVKKQVDFEVTWFVYVDEGLVGEYSALGGMQKVYGWKPGGLWGTDPLYMLDGSGTYFYHNDHLGTPQRLSDATTGAVVWSAGYAAFGAATVDPLSTVENHLRFPGQYFDAETGLHYNFQRTYDPEAGRYTQVDPIGFESGEINLSNYSLNNPILFYDEDGLSAKSFTICLTACYLGLKTAEVAGLLNPDKMPRTLRRQYEKEVRGQYKSKFKGMTKKAQREFINKVVKKKALKRGRSFLMRKAGVKVGRIVGANLIPIPVFGQIVSAAMFLMDVAKVGKCGFLCSRGCY